MLAKLSSKNGYTILKLNNINLRFIASPVLIRYIEVLKWKDGMLTVLTEYSTECEPVPEYLDIADAFRMLMFDDAIWKQITDIEVDYD